MGVANNFIMKNLILLLLFLPVVVFGQYQNPAPIYTQQPIKVNVTQTPNFSQSFTQGMQAGAAVSQAAAANRAANASAAEGQMAALNDNLIEVRIDKLINNDGLYRAIVINRVSGHRPEENTETLLGVFASSDKYIIYDDIKKVPKGLENSNQLLRLNWLRESQSYHRFSTLKLTNSSGEVVYESFNKNIPYSQVLTPLTSIYRMGSEEAIEQIKQLKELLSLEIISQEEFDNQTKVLKEIILER